MAKKTSILVDVCTRRCVYDHVQVDSRHASDTTKVLTLSGIDFERISAWNVADSISGTITSGEAAWRVIAGGDGCTTFAAARFPLMGFSSRWPNEALCLSDIV